jgi:hypothetical protein
MAKKLLVFISAFCLGVLFVFTIKTLGFYVADKNVDNICKTRPFSKKHYFANNEVNNLVGRKIRNKECGKIMCAVGSDNCLAVQEGETGTIVGLKPRFGYSDYLLVVKWTTNHSWRAIIGEHNKDKFYSELGNDGTWEFIK